MERRARRGEGGGGARLPWKRFRVSQTHSNHHCGKDTWSKKTHLPAYVCGDRPLLVAIWYVCRHQTNIMLIVACFSLVQLGSDTPASCSSGSSGYAWAETIETLFFGRAATDKRATPTRDEEDKIERNRARKSHARDTNTRKD